MAGGGWTPGVDAVRPGLYINFVSAAAKTIKGGTNGVVAIPLKSHTGGTAADKQFYTVSNETDAATLFGAANIQSIKFALQAGAKEVLVYTLPTIDGVIVTEDAAYNEAFEGFEARVFNVFAFDGEVSPTTQSSAKTWVSRNRDEGKHFMVVFGGDDTTDADPTQGNARTTTLADDYAVNLINGVIINGTSYNSSEFAPFIAGLIAGTGINASITYAKLPVNDVTKRLTNSQIKTALQAGSLVLYHDGEKVKVERGITTTTKKIRTIRARQAISNDLLKTASDSYIGKINNNAAGRDALITAIRAYLQGMAQNNVITDDFTVGLHPDFASTGDQVYLLIKITEVDSMEEIYIDIQV